MGILWFSKKGYRPRARSKTQISRISRISRIFFSNFYKSVFSTFTYSEYRKLGFQKIRDFQTSNFFKSQFLIFTRRITGQMLEIRDFQTSAFSIFATGEYRNMDV